MHVLAGTALILTSVGASASDVGFGIGISYVFGEGPALGIKAFSNDEDNEAVVSVGLDYVFSSQSIRPNIGVGYQGEGYSLEKQTVDFGLGGGWSNSDDHKKHRSEPAHPPVLI